ncbi:MAG: hypothetical protein AAGJ93_03475, partial [Bacteroidota bacterium]
RRQWWFSWRNLLGGILLLGLVWCGREHIISAYSGSETNTFSSTAQTNSTPELLSEKQKIKPLTAKNQNSDNKSNPIVSSIGDLTNQHLEDIEENSEVGYFGRSALGKGYPKQSGWSKSAAITDSETHQYSETNIATLTNSATIAEVPTPNFDIVQIKTPLVTKKSALETLAFTTSDAINSSSATLPVKQREVLGATSPLPVLWPVEFISLERQLEADLTNEVTPIFYPLTGPSKGIYLNFSVGAGTLARSVSTPMLSATESEIALDHKTAEQTQFNSFANLGIGYQTRSGLFLETGLIYNEKHEQLNWQQTISTDTIQYFNDRAYYSLDEAGDTTYYDGYSERIEKTNRQIRHWNKLKTYQLPLIIGYQQQFHPFSLRGSVGITLNLARNFEGRVVDQNQEVVDNPELDLRTSVGYLANLGVGYQLGDKHQVFMDAAYHRSPQFALLAVEQYYESFNLRLGLRVSLGKTELDQGIAKSQ